MSTRALAIFAALLVCAPVQAADNLRLRDGVSFVHDLDKTFPIVGDKLDDVELSSDHPTVIFFGAAGDLNTNRQAKRMVDLYKKYKANNVKFIVVDVDHPMNPASKQLIRNYYQNYIPGEVLLDKTGKSKWTHTGEVELGTMANQLDKLLD